MPASFYGIGSTFYGKRDFREDGSYITTEWLIVVGIPLIPLRSFRVRCLLPLRTFKIGHPTRHEQGLRRTISVRWRSLVALGAMDLEVIYDVYERRFPPNWRQVIYTYGFFALGPAWVWFLSSWYPSVFPRAFDSIPGVACLLVAWLIPALLPWIMRYYARKTMRSSLGLGSAPGLRKLDRAIRAQLAKPVSQEELGPVPAPELFAQEDQDDLDRAAADKASRADGIAAAYNRSGYHKKRDGDLDGAIADYTRAIELKPAADKAALVYYNRGSAKEEQGDVDGAIEDYTNAIELDPADADAYNNRGYARKGNADLNGAIEDFTQAIQLEPHHADAYEGRSLVRRAKGDLDGACADHSKATELLRRRSGA